MNLQYLSWDSNFFNLKIGKIIIQDENIFDAKTFKEIAAREEYDLIYIYKYNSLLKQDIVFSMNLDLIDIVVEMSKEFSSQSFIRRPFKLKNTLSEKELAESYLIADQTSIVSRFYKEPIINNSCTKALYRKWIDNSLNKSFADGVFIEKIDDSVVGIHVIKTDFENRIGYCSLIGVRNNIKRKGVGRKLWNQAIQYWSEKSIIDKIQISFSLQNSESLKFHLKMGFKNVENISYIYHYRRL